ncbi:hypothetical protein ACFZAE_38065 [Streptomyces scabiei]|uniref:hypothetical protein n=1 Tax=Streptomyces scabiei TaxID=1930 RepID=UPI0036E731E2
MDLLVHDGRDPAVGLLQKIITGRTNRGSGKDVPKLQKTVSDQTAGIGDLRRQ